MTFNWDPCQHKSLWVMLKRRTWALDNGKEGSRADSSGKEQIMHPESESYRDHYSAWMLRCYKFSLQQIMSSEPWLCRRGFRGKEEQRRGRGSWWASSNQYLSNAFLVCAIGQTNCLCENTAADGKWFIIARSVRTSNFEYILIINFFGASMSTASFPFLRKMIFISTVESDSFSDEELSEAEGSYGMGSEDSELLGTKLEDISEEEFEARDIESDAALLKEYPTPLSSFLLTYSRKPAPACRISWMLISRPWVLVLPKLRKIETNNLGNHHQENGFA